MKNLMPGLRKFKDSVFPEHQERFEALAQGQKPHTLLITCSDSRIDPNLMTQTQPGEIFVIRNAGNIVPPYGSSRGGEEAAIEFAIEGLGVSNIVICGHHQCGAMAALMGKVNLDRLPCVASWLSHAQGTARRLADRKEPVELDEVIQENVLVQVENLRTHPSVSAALRAERVHVFGWVYDFASGTVAIYDPRHRRYLPSAEVREEIDQDASRFSL